MPKKGDSLRSSPESVLSRELARELPSLWDLLANPDGEFIELKLYNRGVNDTLGVCKRYGPDGGPQVLFGSGSGFVSCLLAVEGAVRAGRWKVDVPWKERNGK